MLATEQVDELICTLATWDRDTLTRQFLNFQSRFPLDVTPQFLSAMSEDQLRHVFLAVCLQNQKIPDGAEIAA
jgi:hypothetical protein